MMRRKSITFLFTLFLTISGFLFEDAQTLFPMGEKIAIQYVSAAEETSLSDKSFKDGEILAKKKKKKRRKKSGKKNKAKRKKQTIKRSSEIRDYVLNTRTKKFHFPSCYTIKRMKAHNREDYNGKREDLLSSGYSPCKKCFP